MAAKVGPYAAFLLEMPVPASMAPAKAAVAKAESATMCMRCLHWSVTTGAVWAVGEVCPYCKHVSNPVAEVA